MEITYSKYGDYCLPDLVLSEEEPATYGRFGRMRVPSRIMRKFFCRLRLNEVSRQ